MAPIILDTMRLSLRGGSAEKFKDNMPVNEKVVLLRLSLEESNDLNLIDILCTVLLYKIHLK